MAALSHFKMFSHATKLFTHTTVWNLQTVARYAKPAVSGLGGKASKKAAKLGPVVEKKKLPVEADAEKLVKFCCGSNFLKTGQDVELKPDSEYPSWLWTLPLEPPKLEDMDPNTLPYWKRLRKMSLRRQSRLMSLRKF